MAEILKNLCQGTSVAILSADTQIPRTAARILATGLNLDSNQIRESRALNFANHRDGNGLINKPLFFEFIEKHGDYEIILACLPTELLNSALDVWSERYLLQLQEHKPATSGTAYVVEVATGIVHTINA